MAHSNSPMADRLGVARTPRSRSHELLFTATITVLLLQYWIVLTDQFGGLNRDVAYFLLFLAVVPLYAVAVRWHDWRQLAAPGALMLAGLATALFSTVMDRPTVWYGVVMTLLFVHWAPVPILSRPERAHTILRLFAVVPLVMAVVMLGSGPAPDLADLFLHGARFDFGQSSPPTAATFLLSAMASTALLRTGARWPHLTRGAALVMLALTTSRLYMAIALLFGAAVLVRAFRAKQLTTPAAWLTQTAPWAVLALWGFVRALPRSVPSMGAGPHAIEGIATAGRHDLWQQYIAAGSGDFLTGGGFGRTIQLLLQGVGNGWTPHNTYLYFLIDVGIFGLAVVAVGAAITWTARLTRLPRTDRWVYGVPVLLMPAAGMVEPVFRTLHFTLPLAILLAAVSAAGPGGDEPEPGELARDQVITLDDDAPTGLSERPVS